MDDPRRTAARLGWAIATSAVLASCSPPAATPQVATPPADATAGSAGAGRVSGDEPPPLDPLSLVGTWSFDRTCASGDGMRLEADGTAGFDEGALGLWAVDTGHRLVLIVRDQEMGREPDPLAERRVLVFTPSARVGDDLAGRFGPSRPGEPPRAVNARRCPER